MTAATEQVIREAVEEAEEIFGPLDSLIERSVENPGAPFEPEVLERLCELKKKDRAAFEQLRTRLKQAKIRVTALDQAIQREGGNLAERSRTHADILIGIAEEAELFHASDGTGYADVKVSGHRETWPVRSRGFRRWLTRRYFEETQSAPNSEALQSALNVIEARAHFDAPEREVHVRMAGLKGRLYLDLADDQWRAVEIGRSGWRIVPEPPVRFRRAAGMLPLPIPTKGGSVETLRTFLNVRRNYDFVLVVAWALAVLRNCGPYPALVLAGEQGSAKSTLAAIIRALLDPNSAPLRALPREDRDLFIAATNGHVLAFDNVSGLPSWISDTLCRSATGGGFAVRQLYTDQDEVLFDATRPVILNGIEDVVTRSDLADRAIFLTLEPIPDDQRRPEKELWAAFDRERPQILGAVLDAVAHGLRRLPETSLKWLPRMADFALWATACETALWGSGAFLAAYGDNRAEAVDTVIDADPVATTVRSLMTTRTVWAGTASDLLGALNQAAGEMCARRNPGLGRPAPFRAACAELPPSCARWGSRSRSRGRADLEPELSRSPKRQMARGRNRPHRPYRPRLGIRATSARTGGGRMDPLRTPKPPRPSAAMPTRLRARTLRTVRTQNPPIALAPADSVPGARDYDRGRGPGSGPRRLASSPVLGRLAPGEAQARFRSSRRSRHQRPGLGAWESIRPAVSSRPSK